MQTINKKIIKQLTSSAEQLIQEYPYLQSLQDEIDRRLSKVHHQKNRMEALDIMYKSSINSLHEKINYLDQLIERISKNTGNPLK